MRLRARQEPPELRSSWGPAALEAPQLRGLHVLETTHVSGAAVAPREPLLPSGPPLTAVSCSIRAQSSPSAGETLTRTPDRRSAATAALPAAYQPVPVTISGVFSAGIADISTHLRRVHREGGKGRPKGMLGNYCTQRCPRNCLSKKARFIFPVYKM